MEHRFPKTDIVLLSGAKQEKTKGVLETRQGEAKEY